MIKPILIVKCPHNYPSDQMNDLAKELTKTLEEQYFVLIVGSIKLEWEFQGINTSEMDPAKFEDLIKSIQESIDQDPKKDK